MLKSLSLWNKVLSDLSQESFSRSHSAGCVFVFVFSFKGLCVVMEKEQITGCQCHDGDAEGALFVLWTKSR